MSTLRSKYQKIWIPVIFGLVLIVPIMLQLLNSQAAQASGNTYYVATNGSDTNDGSQAHPWKTIQKAANTLNAGDTAVILSGNYNERVTVSRPGITFVADGPVVMRGFTIRADNIDINGFEITNTLDDSTDGVGIFSSGKYCTIENNYIHEAMHQGIRLNPNSSNCVVANNRLYRNILDGIDISGTNHLIEYNEVWGTIQFRPEDPNKASGTDNDADGIRFFGSGHTLRNNYIHDIHTNTPENIDPHIDCFQTWMDSDRQAASNIIIEQNTCINTDTTSSGGGQGFMIEASDQLVVRNNFIQAFIGVIANETSNSRFYNNLFIGDTTVMAGSSHSLGFYSKNTNKTIFQNNIIYNFYSNIIIKGNTITGGNNLVYRSDGISSIKDSSYDSSNDLWQVDPLFVNPKDNDYHLQAISPAIDAGINLGELVPDDIDNNTRPQGNGVDIGPYEYILDQTHGVSLDLQNKSQTSFSSF
jgi:hypothetical protein